VRGESKTGRSGGSIKFSVPNLIFN
jgi:hypothetical protein